MKQVLGKTFVVIAGLAMICSGCETTKNANNKQKGAVIGAASGAVIGGVIGLNRTLKSFPNISCTKK